MNEGESRIAKDTQNYTISVVHEINEADWSALAHLTRKAFSIREAASIWMKPNCISAEGLKAWAMQEKRVYIIIRNTQALPLGFLMGVIEPGVDGNKQMYISLIATDPSYQRSGFGKMLFEQLEKEAIKHRCIYISSDTSCKAHSSIAWHLSRGFEKWQYTHYLKYTNYYSIRFRKYLDTAKRPGMRWWAYFKSWVNTHLRWTFTGNITPLVRLRWHLAGKRNSDPAVGKPLSIHQVQAISLDLLKELIFFCKKHQLRYMLYDGTLLGAVRHKGFIPWDDGMDVSMPLPDYEQFIRLFECNNANKQYQLLHGTRLGIATCYSLLADTRTVAIIPTRDREHARPIGLRIFPVFPLADDEVQARRQVDESVDAAQKIRACHAVHRPNKLKYLHRILCNNIILKRHLQRVYEVTHRHPWGSTQRVRALSLKTRELLPLPADCFDTCVELPFEDIQAKVPAQYHAILTAHYGDYMQIPPEEMRQLPQGCFRWISHQPTP